MGENHSGTLRREGAEAKDNEMDENREPGEMKTSGEIKINKFYRNRMDRMPKWRIKN